MEKVNYSDFIDKLISCEFNGWYTEQFDVLTSYNTFSRNRYQGAKTPEELQNRTKGILKQNEYFEQMLFDLFNNPNPEFAEFWQMVAPAFRDTENDINKYRNLVRFIDRFDEKTQYTLLKRVLQRLNYNTNPEHKALYKDVLIKIANSALATSHDKATAATYTKDERILKDALEDLKDELSKNLESKTPSLAKTKEIVNWAQSTIQSFPNGGVILAHGRIYSNPTDTDDYLIEMSKLFNLDNILASGAEYVQKHNSTVEERVVQAEAKATALDTANAKQNTELENLRKQLQFLQEQLNKKDAELKQKETEIDTLKRQLATEKNNSAAHQQTIKNIQAATAKIKTGMFGRGSIKEFQDIVNSYANGK